MNSCVGRPSDTTCMIRSFRARDSACGVTSSVTRASGTLQWPCSRLTASVFPGCTSQPSGVCSVSVSHCWRRCRFSKVIVIFFDSTFRNIRRLVTVYIRANEGILEHGIIAHIKYAAHSFERRAKRTADIFAVPASAHFIKIVVEIQLHFDSPCIMIGVLRVKRLTTIIMHGKQITIVNFRLDLQIVSFYAPLLICRASFAVLRDPRT